MIVKAEYNNGNGVGYMWKTSPYGVVGALSMVHPDDEDIMNQWDSARICEFRCDTIIEGRRAKVLQERYNGIENVYNFLVKWIADNDYKDGDVLMKKIERQKNAAYNQWQESRMKYRKMKESDHMFCDNVVKMRRDFRKKVAAKSKTSFCDRHEQD